MSDYKEKNLFELTELDLEGAPTVDTSSLLLSAVSGGSLPSEPLLFNVQNVEASIEANSILLKWVNPPINSFNYVQVRMSVCSATDYVSHPEYLNIDQSEILYTGQGEFFNYIVPERYEGYLFNFWVCAFNGSPVDTRGLETWSEIG